MPSPTQQQIKRTGNRIAHIFYHVGVDHRRFHLRVAEILLDLAQIDTVQ